MYNFVFKFGGISEKFSKKLYGLFLLHSVNSFNHSFIAHTRTRNAEISSDIINVTNHAGSVASHESVTLSHVALFLFPVMDDSINYTAQPYTSSKCYNNTYVILFHMSTF